MQYKIPVQIENEDPIIFWLSLRQLIIILAFWWVWYSLFESLVSILPAEIAATPWIILLTFGFLIAKFKHSWMTFMQFILAFIRKTINFSERRWIKWVDSFSPLYIWYVDSEGQKKQDNVDFSSKMDKIKDINEKINKI